MKKLIVLLSLFLMTACAAGFDDTVQVAEMVNVVDLTPGRVQYGDKWVRVDSFSDNRQVNEVIRINGRRVNADSSVAFQVTKLFEDLLRINDYRMAQMKGPLIRGEVLEWLTDIQTHFPSSTALSTAAVRLMVLDEEGKVLHSSTYSGKASLKHPFLTESKAKHLAGEAIQTALEGALKDPKFVEALATVNGLDR